MSIVGCMIIPPLLRTESCKFDRPFTVFCFSRSLVISKHNQNIVKNQKLKTTSLGTGLIRLQNTDRSYRNMVVFSSTVGPGPPPNPTPGPGSGSGSWFVTINSFSRKPWILGFLISIILPFWRSKWGPLLKLKEEVETTLDNVEAITDMVEKVADEVEKVADGIGNHLPEGKLKDALEFVEDIAEETSDGAHLAGQLIDKVEDMVEEVEEKVESFMEPNSTDEQLAKDAEKKQKEEAEKVEKEEEAKDEKRAL